MFRACPPSLSRESAAFRFGGCGTHENVLYYDMVRDLIWNCWNRVVEPRAERPEPAPPGGPSEELTPAGETFRLEQVRHEWLSTPDFEDLGGRPPAEVIDMERMRIPMVASGNEAVVDPDCPLCQMMAEDSGFGPMFWHLDGCNMDDDFPFSFYATREEWEEYRCEQEAWDREFEAQCQDDLAEIESEGSDSLDDNPFGDSSVWQRGLSRKETRVEPLSISVFGIGACVAELGVDLKQSSATRPYMESLNRHFGNLRMALGEPDSALVEPVIARFCEELHAVSEARADLGEKCTDLERQLRAIAARLWGEGDDDEEPLDWRDDIPF